MDPPPRWISSFSVSFSRAGNWHPKYVSNRSSKWSMIIKLGMPLGINTSGAFSIQSSVVPGEVLRGGSTLTLSVILLSPVRYVSAR
jgi:hypothetical protein